MVYTDLPVDNRVKERLTGALILVAAGVILVPEIFSGRPRTAVPTEAPLAAPASDGPPLRSYTADLVESPEPQPSVAQPARAPEPAPSPPPVAATPSQSQSPSPPPPPPPPPPPASTASTAAPARGGWYVQVGGFSQAANAERLASQLREQGYAVSVLTPGNGNKLTRVRVGPAADRAAAVALEQRLRAAGHGGSLIAP